MPGNQPTVSDRECAVFSRYLVQQEPTSYVLQKYRHACAPVLAGRRASAFERAQMRIARVHPLLTRLADAYARFLTPRSMLRVKLILLLAILESSAPAEQCFRRNRGVAPALMFLILTAHALLFALTLLLSVIVFLPIHVLTRVGARSGTAETRPQLSAERT